MKEGLDVKQLKGITPSFGWVIIYQKSGKTLIEMARGINVIQYVLVSFQKHLATHLRDEV
jgi:hypothetical protein